MKLKEFIKFWLPVFIWAGFIFYLSSIPNLKTSRDPYWDEITRSFLHIVFYFIFSLLWWRALRFLPSAKKALFTLISVFLYSLTDEIHQYFVPTRDFQIADLIIDNLGSVFGVLGVGKLLPKAPPGIKNLAKKLTLV